MQHIKKKRFLEKKLEKNYDTKNFVYRIFSEKAFIYY